VEENKNVRRQEGGKILKKKAKMLVEKFTSIITVTHCDDSHSDFFIFQVGLKVFFDHLRD